MTAREQLTKWVAAQHKGQMIKRTVMPFFDHLLAVARLAEPATALGYEIGLCHDLLEDTAITAAQLANVLLKLGYNTSNARLIVHCVTELTDVYTKVRYPELPKTSRKALEAERLIGISPAAQTVKYADLIDNIHWVLVYDKKSAGIYLRKKEKLLSRMNKGNAVLRKQVLTLIKSALYGY